MSNDPRTRLIIVDDDPMVRAFLNQLVAPAQDIDVVGEAMDGAAAVEETLRLTPDVVLMDLRMPGVDGVAATAEIVRMPTPPRVLVMTTFNSDAQVLAALRAGASGYLLKTTPTDQLVQTIRVIAAGGAVLSPESLERLVQSQLQPERPTTPQPDDGDLTDREKEVLAQVADGCSNAEIGAYLYLSEATIKGHVSRLMSKFDCVNRTQLALLAHYHSVRRQSE
ncbi:MULTISPECIES: response regulator [unclassified Brevibacterium]|uniref:response regulator n=1 Tax=unclassified Brevibacterium TaxID=2614124 RepID=UPI000C77E50B|nr:MULTISPECIES: response regulator transcription factor [unclassified Brevibacterium]